MFWQICLKTSAHNAVRSECNDWADKRMKDDVNKLKMFKKDNRDQK